MFGAKAQAIGDIALATWGKGREVEEETRTAVTNGVFLIADDPAVPYTDLKNIEGFPKLLYHEEFTFLVRALDKSTFSF